MNKLLSRYRMLFACTSGLLLIACNQSPPENPNSGVASPTQQNTPVAINEALQQIDEAGYMSHINILASDEFEGRAPSTPGGKKTVEYLANTYKQLGLAPAFGDSYRQAVELMALEVTNSPALTLSFADGEEQALPYKEQSIVTTSRSGNTSALENSQLVFVGYGVVAPEYGWNDYAGLDMKGKTAVILVNDPGFRKPEGALFNGLTMTYYGRWTYKYEEAAKQGAAGAIIVHEDKAAGYPWGVVASSWSGVQYHLYTEDGNRGNLSVESWITKDAAEALFAKNGMNYQTMVQKAGEPGFTPIPITTTASTALELTSERSTSYNVAGVIKGRERPEEAFIYMGHWDHLGIKKGDSAEDVIYNGAQDNATGIAALLELAQAYQALPEAPQRSIIFLSVTAEESGLLGSLHYSKNPAFPMNKTVAGINIDGMSTIGATDDIVVIGYGNSEMDDYLTTVSTEQGRIVVPESSPEKGYFYRSDHFNLAKQGVPMLYAGAGSKVRGKPEGYGESEARKYTKERYHKPADEVHAEWDNGGIMQDMEAQFRIGIAISDSDANPQWAKANEFRAIREASQK